MNDETAVVTVKNTGQLSSQMDSILRVAELLEKGVRGTSQLMREIGVSRPTAIRYRNEAMKILHSESKAFNTEAMRNMEIGRLHYWIDKLQVDINALGDDKDDREYKNKLLGRLDNFQGRLHSITGLNTSVNINYEEKKRITFVMSDTPSTTTNEAATTIEGEVIDTPVNQPESSV